MKQALTDAAVRSAIEATQGCILFAAQTVGATREEFLDFAADRPWVARLVEDFRDRLVDDARMHLHTGVLEQQPWAIKEALQSLGRERGYGTPQDAVPFVIYRPAPPAPIPDLDSLTDESRARLQELIDLATVEEANASPPPPRAESPKGAGCFCAEAPEAVNDPCQTPKETGSFSAESRETINNLCQAEKAPVPFGATPDSSSPSEADVRAILRRNLGHLACAADQLGLTRGQLSEFIAVTPALQRLLKGFDDDVADLAEWGLRVAVNNKKPWAICFTLRTRGRRLGYGKRPPARDEGPWLQPAPRFDLRRLSDEQAADLHRLLSTVCRVHEGQGAPSPPGVHPVDQP